MTRLQSRLLLAAVLAVLFVPMLVRGEVVYPHDNTLEVGQAADPPLGRASNRRLSDESHYFVPALQHHLQGASSGWISLWNPHGELGRPEVQLYALGKAFPLTHVFSWFSSDPFRVHTWLAIAAVSLACLFGLLLLEALDLHPAACLTGALGIGIGSLTRGALCFTLFQWGVCWTAALLWCTTLFARRPSAARALGVAFFTYALLLTAYPQVIVWQAYVLAGYALFLAWRRRSGGRSLVLLAQLAGAALVGVLAAAPVYVDLWQSSQRSSRIGFDAEFLLDALPALARPADVAAFAAPLFDAFLFGNPTGAAYPIPLRDQSLALLPLWSTLACAALVLLCERRLWPVFGFVLVAFLLSVWRDGYLFAARYLGAGLSRGAPAAQALVPLVVLGACAADRVLRDARVAKLATLPALAGIGCGLGAAFVSDLEISAGDAAFGLALALGAVLFLVVRSPRLLLFLAVAATLGYGARLRANRGMDEIRLTSPLVEFLRAETAEGTRIAWMGSTPGGKADEKAREESSSVGPNQESLVGLRSIHTYNPLSSRAYLQWASRFAGPEITTSHGRRFTYVVYQKPFWNSERALLGLEYVLAREELDPRFTDFVQAFEGIRVHRPKVAPLLALQTARWEQGEPREVRIAEGGAAEDLAVERLVNEDERLVFRTTPAERPTLLVVGQQQHPGWRARSHGTELATVRVNDLYQGVWLPPGTSEVELVYRSPARWSWIPQVGFALAAVSLAALGGQRRRRATVPPHAGPERSDVQPERSDVQPERSDA